MAIQLKVRRASYVFKQAILFHTNYTHSFLGKKHNIWVVMIHIGMRYISGFQLFFIFPLGGGGTLGIGGGFSKKKTKLYPPNSESGAIPPFPNLGQGGGPPIYPPGGSPMFCQLLTTKN